MPMPKRADVDDFFAQLDDAARPHMERLRQLSRGADPALEEKLAWNTPSYALDGDRLWMLQAFKQHCSVRFDVEWFGRHRDEVIEAGYDAGAGFIKLPHDRDIPEDVVTRLMQHSIDEHG